MKCARHAIKAWRVIPDAKKERATARVVWRHEGVPTGLVMDSMADLHQVVADGRADDSQARLTAQLKRVVDHGEGERRRERQASIQAAIQKRDANYEEESGKGKGRVIASIFQVVREYQDIQWVLS